MLAYEQANGTRITEPARRWKRNQEGRELPSRLFCMDRYIEVTWTRYRPGESTLLYKPYRYVPPQGRYGLCADLVWKTVYTLPILVWNGYSFRGNHSSVWMYSSFQSKWIRRKGQYTNSMSSCWRAQWSWHNFCLCKHVCCVLWPPPGLKTDAENDIFWSEISSGFNWRIGRYTPTKNSQEYLPGDVSVPSRVRENTVLKNAHSGELSNLVKANVNPFFVKDHNALGRAAGITLCTITKTRTLLLTVSFACLQIR